MDEDDSSGLWGLTTQVAHTLKEAAATANVTYVFLKELITTEEECLRADFHIPEGEYCNSTWDRIYCWPHVSSGTTIYLPCPRGFDGSKLLAYRTCDLTGQWQWGPWTNYTACLAHKLPEPIMTFVVRDIYFYGSCLSLAFLLATVFIYYYLKRLSSSGRITIHKNLAISFLLYYIFSVVLFEPYISTPENLEDSYRQVPGLCKFLVGAQRYFFTTNVFWMFVEGIHLHKRIAVAVFSAEANMLLYSAIGWGIPSLLVIAWSVVMVMFHAHACWDQYNKLPYIWILSGPIYLVLSVNLGFLINIIRILVQKLKEKQTVESQQVTKAAKATLILFPLLGVPHLLLLHDLAEGGAAQWIYQIFNAVMQAMQGVFIAVIYCFFDLEVQREFRRIISRWSRRRSSTLRRTSSSALTRQSHRPLAVDRSFDRSLSNTGSFRMHSMRRGVDSGYARSTSDDLYPRQSLYTVGQRVEVPNDLRPISADVC
ncbi:corticotropin-releasing factor receptor 2-like isoform X2 [Branchiostoma floridae]|uniref:Corticotropin-releasing factor receptor 2-like isoform X2 n=1 Tax=Branchiostoma floridae TaxID=7739 RepID=A0A9J7LRA8_BRAFL|nr:corticotropin-releasing factor receptor 2-like isoform X2 [Branchiostoma floridae]